MERRRVSDPATLHAASYAVILIGLLLATSKWRVDPALALALAAAALAGAAGWGIGDASRRFSEGVGAGAAEQGFGVLAVSWVGQVATSGGAAAWLARAGRRFGLSRVAPVALGILAGPAVRPAAALAVIQPVAAGLAASRRRDATLQAALSCSAAHGWLLPSPVMIAAVTILDADWRVVLAVGLPGAVLLAVCGGLFQAALPSLPDNAAAPAQPVGTAPAGLALLAASAVMLLMLCISSLGNIPSEPLGGGHARDLVIGLGRPLSLVVGGGAIVTVAALLRRAPLGRIDWHAAAPLVVVLAAAAGLQFVAQDIRMGDVLAERAATEPWGLLAPFAAAALLKLVYGSSLTAAISAAGIAQPLLGSLGLVTPWDHALAALAVGTGSMTGATVTDGFFWLTCGMSNTRPDSATLRLTLPTLLQGALAMLILLALQRL
jgi:GntP family gluconate:H+ symporter